MTYAEAMEFVVAPYAGAWIETAFTRVTGRWRGGRPLRGGVD